MEYKKNLEGGRILVKGLGIVLINQINKQLLFNNGHLNLFKDEPKDPEITTEQISGNVKRTKKRSKSE